MISILVVVLVSSLNNYSKERQFRSLKSEIEADAKFLTVRDGQQCEVRIHDLVVGDVLLIKYGMFTVCGVLIQFVFRQRYPGR